MSNKQPVEIDGITGEVETLPPQKGRRYRCKLDTLVDVQREMARVYKETRSGLVDVQDATKLTWCLQAIGKVIESSDLEQRIEALEPKENATTDEEFINSIMAMVNAANKLRG